jgi:hypothetical protein
MAAMTALLAFRGHVTMSDLSPLSEANRILSRHRRMTEFDPSLNSTINFAAMHGSVLAQQWGKVRP